MQHDIPSAEKQPVNADVQYEPRDLRLGPIAAIGGGLVVLALVIHVSLAWMFDALREEANQSNPHVPALAAKERLVLPEDLSKIPDPRLQVAEAWDMGKFREKEEKQLNSYGWVDAKKGTVHIPVAEALRLLADPAYAESKGILIEQPKDKAPQPGPKGDQR